MGDFHDSMRRSLSAIAALVLSVLACVSIAIAQDGVPVAPSEAKVPDVVREAVETAKVGPDAVTVGAYINDIHELDFRSHTYSVDLYIWFRWKNAKANPVKTMEFMNRYSPTDHQRDVLLDEPKVMPDGSLYNIIREQGRFSSKFRLEKYPFDRQTLEVIFEDTVASVADQSYVAQDKPIESNPEITLPGYKVAPPRLMVSNNHYTTNFGDISMAETDTYSRVTIGIPVSRPLLTVSIKTFVPILLIIMSSTLGLFVRPSFVEGRIGLTITALLTLVALQLTASSSLPDVDYLMLNDKAYLASYAFIIAVLARVVATSWVSADSVSEVAVARLDRRWAALFHVVYWAVIGLSVVWTMLRF